MPSDLNDLWPDVQSELREVAHNRLRNEREGHTLNTTALMHEVYLKLSQQRNVDWGDKRQFFALASQAMRRLLIDYARKHRQMRDKVSVDASMDGDADDEVPRVQLAASERADTLVALDEALDRLAAIDERLAKVVELRFFGGYTEEETAEALGVTPRTVTRDWAKAKAWLYRELNA